MPTKPKRVYKRRKPAAARRPRRAAITKSVNPRFQVATVEETLDPQISILDNVAVSQIVQLGNFPRCVKMSHLYEQFRIEEVKFVYTPLYGTFIEAPVGAPSASPSIPVMYHVMDRLSSLASTTTGLSDLTQMGAQRRKFTKQFTIKYRPNTMITTGVANPGYASNQILQINGADYGRWFPCVTQLAGSGLANTPNTLSALGQIYNGHWVYFEQGNVGLSPAASVTITVRVSFKNPLINQNATDDTVIPWVPVHGPRETPTYTTVG